MDFLLQQASEDINEMNVIFITLHMFDQCFQSSTITGNGTNITATNVILWASKNLRLKALAHYNWNYKECRYRPYTLQLFFATATIFSTVFYMGKDFHNNFFGKILVKNYCSVWGPSNFTHFIPTIYLLDQCINCNIVYHSALNLFIYIFRDFSFRFDVISI